MFPTRWIGRDRLAKVMQMAATATTHVERDTGEPRRNGPFRWFGNIRLALKLPLIISVLAGLMALIIAVTSYFDAEKIMTAEIKQKFGALLESRSEQLEALFKDAQDDLLTQASNPTTLSALNSFALAWRTIGGGQTDQLQDAYITRNDSPAGNKDALDSVGDGSQYDMFHAKFHPYFRKVLRSKGYHDIFMIDTSGNVVYTVYKEADFATNLIDGPWQDSHLAQVFNQAIAAEPGTSVFADFEAYGPSNGAPASFLATPVSDGKKLRGVLVFQMPADRINGILQDARGLGRTGQSYAVGGDYTLRSDSRFAEQGQILSPVKRTDFIQSVFATDTLQVAQTVDAAGNPVLAMGGQLEFHGTTWAVVIKEQTAELYEPISELRSLLAMQFSVLLAVLVVIGWLVGRGVARPFQQINQRLQGVADGDLTTAIPMTQRGDDVGDLARNLDNLRQKLDKAATERREAERRAQDQRNVVDHLTTSISALSEGDLTTQITTKFAEDYEVLRTAYNSAVAKLHETVTSLLMAAQNIDGNAREVENASNDLSQKAIEQAASLEETAAAITELSASVKSTADAAGDADRVMTRAKSNAQESGQVVTRAMGAMDEISSSSQKITQVTSVIEDLAFQTNLLALNAGVEAARAGEAGRGFAVVASEVRALAQRSSEAAKEINSLIQESAENVVSGVELVEKAGASFDDLIGEFDKVSGSVSSIASAAREQAAGIQEINAAVDQLDGVTQKNAAVATQVHGTGKVMVSEAERLMRVSSAFRVQGLQAKTPAAPQSAAPMPVAPAARQVVNAGVATLDDISDDSWDEF
jgi:methyl-accepting chemotaxis protein